MERAQSLPTRAQFRIFARWSKLSSPYDRIHILRIEGDRGRRCLPVSSFLPPSPRSCPAPPPFLSLNGAEPGLSPEGESVAPSVLVSQAQNLKAKERRDGRREGEGEMRIRKCKEGYSGSGRECDAIARNVQECSKKKEREKRGDLALDRDARGERGGEVEITASTRPHPVLTTRPRFRSWEDRRARLQQQ